MIFDLLKEEFIMKTYERKSFPRTARDLKVMYEKGNLSFDNAVQRSFVWKNTTKDNRKIGRAHV